MPILLKLLYSLQLIKLKRRGCTFFTNVRAFTLIELLITVGIIALIAGVVLPNLRNFNQNEGLTIAKAGLFDDLRLAKSKADSGVVCPGSPISIASLQIIYAVELRRSGYTLKYQCVNDTSTPPIFYPTPNQAPYKAYPVSTNVRMIDLKSSSSGPAFCDLTNGTNYATITFKARTCTTGSICASTEISCTAGGTTTQYTEPIPISLTLQNAQNLTKVISISPGGTIYEN